MPSLFDSLERGTPKPKPERAIARGACPFCSANAVAIVRSTDGLHFVWRMHDFVTFAGTALPCGSTAQHLCVAPPRVITGVYTPRCPHETPKA